MSLSRSRGNAGRRPLSDPIRIQRHDTKLWQREVRLAGRGRMICPCRDCGGECVPVTQRTAFSHVLKRGRHPRMRLPMMNDDIDSSDEEWNSFGIPGDHFPESAPSNYDQSFVDEDFDIGRMVIETFGVYNDVVQQAEREESQPDMPEDLDYAQQAESDGEASEHGMQSEHTPNVEAPSSVNFAEAPFPKDFAEACKPLFPGATHSKLSLILIALSQAATHNLPRAYMDELFTFYSMSLFPGQNFPRNRYAALKMIEDYGLQFNSIHACPEGCVLYRGIHAKAVRCPKCNRDRYKDMVNATRPIKVLRHFPLIPRLLRMYRCSSISKLLTWAASNRSTDGRMRQPADSNQWKHIDTNWPRFAMDPRNLRLGLALDGINPFHDRNNPYSVWPVVTCIYNLPPWLVTKRFFLTLCLLIPGPRSVTSKNMDVFLAPFVEDLELLWKGVPTVDVVPRASLSANFTLRAMLMWTINDYQALGIVSGLCTKGFRGCIVCGPQTDSYSSKACRKVEFRGHRRYLPIQHVYRSRTWGKHFDNKPDMREPPHRTSGTEILNWALEKIYWDNSSGEKRPADDPYKRHGVKRRSILFNLSYWKDLKVRHIIDVMHTEKNVCDSLLGFLLGDKDSPSVRNDLQDQNIRRRLWLRQSPISDTWLQPTAPYVLTDSERRIFLQRIQSLKVPSGFSAPLSRIVQNGKLKGMKSHDYHIIMEHILPAALRGLMAREVRMSVIQLSCIFRRLCSKVIEPASISGLRHEVALTLCKLEIHFPPAFFDVMVHLIIHCTEEVEICGPVHTRWMYPIERFMKQLKVSMKNTAKPEGSMAAAYVRDETTGFLTEYWANYDVIKTRIWDRNPEEGVVGEVAYGKSKKILLSEGLRDAAHEFVLTNTDKLQPWILKYNAEKQLHTDGTFPSLSDWVQLTVRQDVQSGLTVDSDMLLLSNPPATYAYSYNKMLAYGNTFRCVGASRGGSVNHYDSGIGSMFYQQTASESELQPSFYVGELQDILKLEYGNTTQPIILFRGKWVESVWSGPRPSMKYDEHGLMLADFRRIVPMLQDPFVWPEKVEQVFFMDMEERPGWKIVLHKEAREKRIEADTLPFNFMNVDMISELRNTSELSQTEPLTADLDADMNSNRIQRPDGPSKGNNDVESWEEGTASDSDSVEEA